MFFAGPWTDAHAHPRADCDAGPGVVLNAVGPADWPLLADFLLSTGCKVAFGVHPWHVEAATPGWENTLADYLQRFPGAAVGEIGLDFSQPAASRETQLVIFASCLRLAVELTRPVCLHGVRAWSTVATEMVRLGWAEQGFLCHDFRGSVEEMWTLQRLGGYFSVSPRWWPLTERGGKLLRAIPADRLLVESDWGGSRGSTRKEVLIGVYRSTAHHLGLGAEELAEQTRANYRHLFVDC